MIVHLVLFTPREDLTDADRAAFGGALDRALTSIPSIRRFQIGRRVLVGAAYEQSVRDAYEYCGVLEFDDRAALDAYLAHAAHAELGRLFYASSTRTLAHDFETVTSGVADALRAWGVHS